MLFVRRGAWDYLLSAAKAGERVRVELPDGMGFLTALFVEGSRDVAVWREWNSDMDRVELLGLDSARSVMNILPSELQAVWERHYEGKQTREREFLDTLQQISRFVGQGFPVPDWLQEK
jgi:hypothetical protein